MVSTPAGGILTFRDAEFAEVKDGKITSFTVYFDPTEFARAFGVNAASQ